MYFLFFKLRRGEQKIRCSAADNLFRGSLEDSSHLSFGSVNRIL